MALHQRRSELNCTGSLGQVASGSASFHPFQIGPLGDVFLDRLLRLEGLGSLNALGWMNRMEPARMRRKPSSPTYL